MDKHHYLKRVQPACQRLDCIVTDAQDRWLALLTDTDRNSLLTLGGSIHRLLTRYLSLGISLMALLLGGGSMVTGAPVVGDLKEPVDYVDAMIGTSDSRWMLFPGATMPFGMVKLSPDNRKHAWKGGYEYKLENIMGFSHIHSWIVGGLLTMPAVGTLTTRPGTEEDPDAGYRSRFSHASEVASPGYYAVTLSDYRIRAELTATTRAGFMRYTFPESDQARVLFDLKFPAEFDYDVQWAYIRKVSDREIEGFSKQRTRDGFSSLQNEYVLHFVVQFNKPFETFGVWDNDDVQHDTYEVHGENDIGCFVNYKTQAGEVILVKTGISLVSVDQARLNLNTETKDFGWDFDAARKHARKTWNDLLSTVKVEGARNRTESSSTPISIVPTPRGRFGTTATASTWI